MIDINGYEGRYAVTEDGRVWAYRSQQFIKPQRNKRGGYLVVGIGCPQKKFYVHRLVAAAFIPNPDSLPVVHHKDEDPTNSAADNLEWRTHSQNTSASAHKMRNGKHDPVRVREVHAKTGNMAETSRITGVPYHTVRDIIRGRSYAWSK
jgi:altronate dehydratase